MAIDNTGISSLEAGAGEITYSGNEGPKSPDQQLMAQADPMLVEQYQQYVFEMQEQGLQPMSFREFMQQAMSGMAEGGIARLEFQDGGWSPGAGRDAAGYQSNHGSYTGPSRGPAGGASAGGDYGGNVNPNQTYGGGDPIRADIDRTKLAEANRIKKEFEEKAKKEQDAQLSFREKLEQNQIYRNKVLAMRKLGLMPKGLPGLWGNLISSLTGKVPEWAEDLTEEELLAMASDIQGIKDYNQATYNPNLNPTKQGSGAELLGRVFEGGPFNTGNMNLGDGGGEGITSQYPYYIPPITQADATGQTVVEDPTLPVDPIRFASNVPSEHDFSSQYFYGADGGNVRQRYGLGKLVKKATKAIGKVAKSPIGMAALTFGLGSIPFGASKASLFSRMGTKLPFDWAQKAARTGEGGLWSRMLGSMSSNPFPWIAGASALGGLYTGMTQDDDEMPEWLKKWYADKAAADAQFSGISKPSNLESIRFADGGRTGYEDGKGVMMASYDYNDAMAESFDAYRKAIKDGIIPPTMEFDEYLELMQGRKETAPQGVQMAAQGGRIGYDEGKKVLPHRTAALSAMYRPKAQEGGLMDLGGMEKDYRQEGGFVPIGGQERADDVPARLSKNEFVFTADAVRAAGGGDIEAGSEVMQNMMDNLEAGGEISEESQGLEGAQAMYDQQQMLQSRIA